MRNFPPGFSTYSTHCAATVAALLLPAIFTSPRTAANSDTAGPAKTNAVAHTSAPSPTQNQLTENQKILHALNRLGFGPRPGDVERVSELGLHRWMEAQLAPETLDDSALEQKLARLTSLQLPSQQLALAWFTDRANFIKKARKERQPIKEMQLTPRQMELAKRIEASGFPQRISVQALGELRTAKVVRAAESKRQLQEVLVDFWSNHFNLDIRKGPILTYKLLDDREVIRPHIFSKFRQLLGASAKSPAMLLYLDNARSSVEQELPQRMQPPGAERPKTRGGINENYARELMELHTLGVDGGYTQQDVQEVARCFTGWSINFDTGAFRFQPRRHDNGAKVVLGHTIPAGGGIGDGERVLDILAAHPSTARFIAHKLCVRLVADEPPAALVARAAKSFTHSGGDLRVVVRTIIFSPEFFSPAAYRAKIKSPFEYAVSAVRALNGTVAVPNPELRGQRLRLIVDGAPNSRNFDRLERSLVQQIAIMGQPLFAYQAPTGYSEDSREWVSSGALVARLNFALALVEGKVAGVALPPVNAPTHPTNELFDLAAKQLLGGEVSPATRGTIERELAAQHLAHASRLAALLLGSPEFQRR